MPHMNAQSFLTQAMAVLEWNRVLEVLAGQARSPMGVEFCRALPLEADLEAAQARLLETVEMMAFKESGDPFPTLSFPDVREAIDRAAKGAPLETRELRDVSTGLGLGADVIRYLGRHRGAAPALSAAALPLETFFDLHQLKVSIDRAVDAEGNIRESATPELRRLTHHAAGLKQQMRHRMDTILASKRYAEVLQERYFAQREGRYVVPIKDEMRGKIPGIVHDVSASGATVFLEPRELVELNNSIKVADLEVQREVRRILQELSAMVAGQAAAVLAGLHALARMDGIAAKAAFGRLVRGQPVTLNDRGRVMLRQARHPLLVLGRERVVANDVLLDEAVRVLVISGPNTGGKTVTLKIVGLFALMVRAGLPLPCADDSEMAVFPEIYADIGDAQDLARDLSSFSAHMTQMIRLLQQASPGRSKARALVLLDEPVTSTDPAEGAALAEALLLRLADLNMKVVATTHYNQLKILAQSKQGFKNASVEFDVGTLSPTYRLIMGLPGGSSAIEIAGRLGMDEAILDHAMGLLNKADRSLDQVLGELQERQRRLSEDTARAAELRAEAERAAKDASEIAERLRASEREERKGTKKKLTDELLRARAQVQGVLEEVKRERTLIKVREAKQKLADIEAQEQPRLADAASTVPVDRLRIGDRVELARLGKTGALLEAPQGKKRVRVRVGDVEMSVAVSSLIGLSGPHEPERVAAAVPRRLPSGASLEESEAATVLDLRGRMADEALDTTVAALDRATLAGAPLLRIIHGHGTGRLKAVIRDYLKGSPYVASFRAGERAEGGDGVTVVELK
jgi:DNA mismatch repair protein MutS2